MKIKNQLKKIKKVCVKFEYPFQQKEQARTSKRAKIQEQGK